MQQEIEVGDKVQLTATALFAMNLSLDGTSAIQDMIQRGQTGGSVIAVTDECVTVDTGTAEPLVLECQGSVRNLTLQVVEKMKKPEPEPALSPAPAPAQPTQQTPTQQTPSQVISQLLGFGQLEGPPPAQTELQTPPQVRLAQWVMVQIVGLKQYGIAQDLHRVPDADTPRTGASFHEKDLRAVHIELTATEESLYNTALCKIGQWISGERPVFARTVHPEKAGEDAQSAEHHPQD